MTELRTRMVRDMTLRGFSPRTHKSYIAAVVHLARYYRRSPEQLTDEEVQAYLLHLVQHRKLAWASVPAAGVRARSPAPPHRPRHRALPRLWPGTPRLCRNAPADPPSVSDPRAALGYLVMRAVIPDQFPVPRFTPPPSCARPPATSPAIVAAAPPRAARLAPEGLLHSAPGRATHPRPQSVQHVRPVPPAIESP